MTRLRPRETASGCARLDGALVTDFARIAQAALSNAGNLLLYLFPLGHQTGREFCVGNLNGAPGDSLKVNLDTGKWTDFASGDKGGADLISLWARVHDCNNGEAAKEMAARLGLSFSNSSGNNGPGSEIR
jgi:putative DNA primase/helicase